ncbi:MAG: hypothetical protein KIT69_03655 [Propionibacteriaceae bacterium]|nr:hypothetical protein [Propionibacteriaceae bacterium]
MAARHPSGWSGSPAGPPAGSPTAAGSRRAVAKVAPLIDREYETVYAAGERPLRLMAA